MRWYSHLYVGEQAAKKRYAVIQKIRNGTGGQNIYVITPASNGNNLLDIYSAGDFSHPYYQQQDMLIVRNCSRLSGGAGSGRKNCE